METKIKMVAAATEVFSYKRKNPMAIHEEIFQHVSDYITESKIKDQKTKLAMIAAAGRAFEISNKNPNLPEKEQVKIFVEEIPNILYNIQEEY